MTTEAKVAITAENRIGAALRDAARDLKGFETQAKKYITGAFAGVSIAGIVAGTSKILEFGDQLNKATQKSGTTAESFSQLAYAARSAGVDTGSLSTALAKMQVALSNARTGGKEQKEALDALGLSMKDLIGLSLDRQFELIGDRISKLKDPADRARAAIVFFGKAGADLLPMFEQGAAGIRAAREEAVRLGQSFSKEQLQKMTDAKDSVDRLKESFGALAATLVAKVAPSLKPVIDNLTALVSGDRIGKLREQIDFLERMSKEEGFFNFGSYAGFGTGYVSAGRAGKQAEILRAQLKAAQASATSGGSSDTGQSPGFTDPNATTIAADRLIVRLTAQKSAANPMKDLLDSWEEATRTSAEKAGAEFGTFTARLEEQLKQGEISIDEYNKRVTEAIDSALPEMATGADKLAGHYKASADAISAYADQAARNMQSAFADFLFDPFESGVKGMLKSFVDTIRRMVAEVLASKLFDYLGALGSSKGGILGTVLGFFGGGKAAGGPVSAGGTYLVGENGPELLRMGGASGTIIPNGAGGLVFAPVTNVTLQGGASEEDRAAFAAMLAQNNRVLSEQWRDQLRANGYRLR